MRCPHCGERPRKCANCGTLLGATLAKRENEMRRLRAAMEEAHAEICEGSATEAAKMLVRALEEKENP